MSKWLGVFMVLGSLVAADEVSKPAQSKDDLEQMQGKWQAVVMEVGGKPNDADVAKKMTLIVKKDDFRIKVNGDDHVTAKLVLETKKKPKELDLVLETGPVYKGIYVIDGDTLKICFCLSSDADSPRPKEFKSDEDSNTAFFTWERSN